MGSCIINAVSYALERWEVIATNNDYQLVTYWISEERPPFFFLGRAGAYRGRQGHVLRIKN